MPTRPRATNRRSRDREVQATLQGRKTRWERFVRAGAGHASPSNVVESPGTGITAPILAGEEAAPATVSFSIEFFGEVNYPNTNHVQTGAYTILITAAGLFVVNGPIVSTVFDLTDPSQPHGGIAKNSGVHYMTAFFDPPGGRLGVFFDGDLIDSVVGAPYPAWSSGTWSYLNTVNAVGVFGPLEVYPGFIPPTFI